MATISQNLKYMKYIALTNQSLLIHDVLHDFSPSSNKTRLSKSTNLIKQTIMHITNITASGFAGGKREQRGGRGRKVPSLSQPIERQEEDEIVQFFTRNLLSARDCDRFFEQREAILRRGRRSEGKDEETTLFTHEHQYFIFIPTDGIMSRSASWMRRLKKVRIVDEEKRNIIKKIKFQYNHNFIKILNTYLNDPISGLRRSLRIQEQRNTFDMATLYSIIVNVRNNLSIDDFVTSPMNIYRYNAAHGSSFPVELGSLLFPLINLNNIKKKISGIENQIIPKGEGDDMDIDDEDEATVNDDEVKEDIKDNKKKFKEEDAAIALEEWRNDHQNWYERRRSDQYNDDEMKEDIKDNKKKFKEEVESEEERTINQRTSNIISQLLISFTESYDMLAANIISLEKNVSLDQIQETVFGISVGDNPIVMRGGFSTGEAEDEFKSIHANLKERLSVAKVEADAEVEQLSTSESDSDSQGDFANEAFVNTPEFKNLLKNIKKMEREKKAFEAAIKKALELSNQIERERQQNEEMREAAIKDAEELSNQIERERQQNEEMRALQEKIRKRVTEWRKKTQDVFQKERIARAKLDDLTHEEKSKEEEPRLQPRHDDEASWAQLPPLKPVAPQPVAPQPQPRILDRGRPAMTDDEREIVRAAQVFPSNKVSDIQNEEAVYNRLLNSFDELFVTYSNINDIDDLILLNFMYIMKISFIYYRKSHPEENVLSILGQEQYKNMVFTGYLFIVSKTIFNKDIQNDNKFVLSENFIDIIFPEIEVFPALPGKTDVIEEADIICGGDADCPDDKPKCFNTQCVSLDNYLLNTAPAKEVEEEDWIKGGGETKLSIIQKGGNSNLVDEYSLLIATNHPTVDPTNTLSNYNNWINGAITILENFQDTALLTPYNNYKKFFSTNHLRKVKQNGDQAQGFFAAFIEPRSVYDPLKRFLYNRSLPSAPAVDVIYTKLVLGIPQGGMKIGSSLFGEQIFNNLSHFVSSPFDKGRGVRDFRPPPRVAQFLEFDLDLFVKNPINWIFIQESALPAAFTSYKLFYQTVTAFPGGDREFVIQCYEYIAGAQPRPFRVSARRVADRLLYGPANYFIEQYKGFFSLVSPSAPAKYLGYRIDQRIKNLKEKQKRILIEINKEARFREKEERKAARRAAREAREAERAARDAERAARAAASGIITGKTHGFADRLTMYIARKGLDKIKMLCDRFLILPPNDINNIPLDYDNDKTKYWTTIISRLCVNYDDWVMNVDNHFSRLIASGQTSEQAMALTRAAFPLGNPHGDIKNIPIHIQLVRKLFGLELFCLAQAAKYVHNVSNDIPFSLSHTIASGAQLQDIVPGEGLLDGRLRTGVEDILTNSNRPIGYSNTTNTYKKIRGTPFNVDQFAARVFNYNTGGPFSLKNVKDNILIYGGTITASTDNTGAVRTTVINGNPIFPSNIGNSKFYTNINPVNTRYIINNAADLKNLKIPYTRPSRSIPDKVYPNSVAEKRAVNNNTNINNICTTSSIVDKQPQCTYNVAVTNNNRLSLNTKFELYPDPATDNITYIGEVINKERIDGVEQNGMVAAYNINVIWDDMIFSINKNVNIETGADLKAPLVYETVLQGIRDYFTRTAARRHPTISKFWDSMENDDSFFQDLFTKILVKSQGDMIQEINSTFKYGAMENMKDWQIDSTKATDEDKDRYNMVTANPSLVNSPLSSDPFRIGLSNDQPAGVRKVLYNLYSILNMTETIEGLRTYMNENNISGYFGGTNTLMLRGKYKLPNQINIDPKPGSGQPTNYAYTGGKRKKKTKRKKRNKKKSRRKNKRKKKTKRRRRKRKKTRRRRR